MNHSRLFRPEASNSRQLKWLGDILLVRPISFTFLAIVATVLACVLLLVLIFGTYTKHVTVVGELIPDTGLVKVYASQFGIVRKRLVTEGQTVKQGDALFILSSERQSNTQGDTQATISNHVESRERSLRDQLVKTRQLQREERNALERKIRGMQAEVQKLDAQIEAQRARVKLADEALTRYQDLVAKHFISTETLQQKQADQLDQKLRLQSVERDRIAVERDLVSSQSDLAGLPLRHQNTLAEIERNIAATGQELTESEAKRGLIVTAPEDGVATALMADIGQAVDASRPLASIVPKGATLQAYLYAPSSAIGFVRSGESVLLRYQAYPYQKFGRAKGIVESVSRTALPAGEITSLMGNSQLGNAEPRYRITVNLASQVITTYGRPQPLQAGMLLDADVLQETRHLYEWVLEPLYSLTGKL